MKKIIMLSSSLIFLGLFTVSNMPMSFAELYENQEYGFEISSPTGWYIDDYLITYEPFPGYDEGSANFVGFYDARDSWNHSIDVGFIKNYYIAENYQGQEYLDKLESELIEICQTATLEFDGYTCSNYDIMESKMIEIAGHDAYQIVASSTETYDDQNIFDVIGVSIDIPIDNNVWTINSYSLDKEYPLEKNQIDKSIKSFKFTNNGIEPELNYINSENLPSYLQPISPHYVNSDAGLEISFPDNWQGIEMKIPKELLENLDSEKPHPDKSQEQLVEILSGSTIVMAFPEEMMMAQESEGEINMSMMFIMDVSAVANLAEMTEQVTTMSSSPDSLYGDNGSSTPDEPDFDENCEFGSSKILKVNNMKAYEIEMNCALPDMDQNMEILMYMFGTDKDLIILMHTDTSKTGQVTSDLSEFSSILDTLVIENAVDLSDPQTYSEMFDMTIDTQMIENNNISYEITLTSDIPISDFTFDKQSKTMEFMLMAKPNDNSHTGFTDIHLVNGLPEQWSSFYATVDGKELDMLIIDDTTSDKTILSLEYPLPASKIMISEQQQQQIMSQSTVASHLIPDWIKINAGWWANDKIDDSTFVSGIQFLIKEEVLNISETVNLDQKSNPKDIPNWVKTNADWWSQEMISDNDFIKGIEYLVENRIIVVN